MSCENCYNGCPDPTPDRCVKYTGVDIEDLDIYTGDPLSLVLEKLTTTVTEVLKGNGIIPRVEPTDICALIQGYLPCCEDVDLNDLLTALTKAICDLDAKVTTIREEINTLNADYNVDCLTGVDATSGTHDVLQEAVLKLCIVANELEAAKLDLSTNYVLKSEIDTYIQAYLSGIPTTTNQSAKMIPYVIYPYYGDITGIFDGTGAGIGVWDKVYLCNGVVAPDLRGLVLVGATNMVGGGQLKDYADPLLGNPTYIPLVPPSAGGVVQGTNKTVLTTAQMPTHSHIATVTINDPGHIHLNSKQGTTSGASGVYNYDSVGDKEHYPLVSTDSALTGLNATNVTVGLSTAGQGLPHDNFQPGVGINYIMYIP